MRTGEYDDAVGNGGVATPQPSSGSHEGPKPLRRRREDDPLAIVIVTYNSAAVLGDLLDSVPDGLAGVSSFDVVVCDNDSQDASADLAAAHPIRPRVIRMGRNAGYAAAINAATATVSPAANVLILNPDLRLQPGAVRAMLDCMVNPSTGIAVPRNLRTDGTIDLTIRREPSVWTAWAESLLGGRLAARFGLGETVNDRTRYERGGSIEWASGSALLVAASARRDAGAWDESFFLYSEEVDFQRRVRACGFKIVYVPQAGVVHDGGDCHTNPWLFALLTTNRIRYFARHHSAISTFVFRLGVAAGEALRAAAGPTHRAALVSALSPLPEFSRPTTHAGAPN
jgi:GT2 family glycosyltransferase